VKRKCLLINPYSKSFLEISKDAGLKNIENIKE